MLSVMRTEFAKIKRSPLIWISLAATAAVVIMVVLAEHRWAGHGNPSSWELLLRNATGIGAMLLGVPLYGPVTVFVFARENADGTWKNMLTLPIRRWWIVAAKLTVLFVWTMALGLSLMLWSLPGGFLIGLGRLATDHFWAYTALALKCSAVIFLTMTPVAWGTLVARNYLPAFGLVVTLTVVTMLVVIMSPDEIVYYPWAIPILLTHLGDETPIGPASWAILAATAIIGAVLAILQLRYADQDR